MSLQAPLNLYDGGLLLTLARFTSLELLPYRDLWTLYGPGPPVFGSLIMLLFGPGTLPIQLGYLLLLAALVLAVFLVCRRFVSPWASVLLSIPAATFGASTFHFHFAWSVALILWGFWFVLRSDEDPSRRVFRAAIGAFLIGSCFWGRFELAPVGALGAVALWAYLRPRLGRGGWVVLTAGLAPPVAFGLYLLVVVGIDRAWLNLVEYPLVWYPRPYCRGLPPVWGQAFRALIAPVEARFWTDGEFTLWVATYAAPAVGLWAAWTGVRRRGTRSVPAFVGAAVGVLTVVLWLEMRGRAGGEPHPVWYGLVPSIAVVAWGLRARRPLWSGAIPVVAGLAFLVVMVASWGPRHLPAWADWPTYHPRYGFAPIEGNLLFGGPVGRDLVATVHRYVPEGEPIFVALHENTGHFANIAIFYWLVDRPPASRFIEFDPCLTDTTPIQRTIVEEIGSANVVVSASYFPQPPPPFAPPATVLDDYLSSHFVRVYEGALHTEGDVAVLVRRDRAPSATSGTTRTGSEAAVTRAPDIRRPSRYASSIR